MCFADDGGLTVTLPVCKVKATCLLVICNILVVAMLDASIRESVNRP